MKKNKKLLLTIMFVVEFIIIFFLSLIIYKNRHLLPINTLTAVKINSLPEANENLKYFYELTPNTKKQIKLDWLPYSPVYTINSDSLNDRFEYDRKKPPGVFRIITLGDSFTFGEFVNTEDNYPEQLEDLLNKNLKCKNINKFEVINLGVGGYDSRYSVERYKIRGQKYNPDLILWFIDSFGPRVNEIKIPLIKKFLEANNIQKNSDEFFFDKNNNRYPIGEKIYNDIIKNYGLKNLIQYQIDSLSLLKNFYNGNTVFFVFNSFDRYQGNSIKNIAEKSKNVFFFNGITNIDRLGEILPDGHPTKKAYTIIAKELYEYLTGENLIPCRK